MLNPRWKNGQKSAYKLIKLAIECNGYTTRADILFTCNMLLPLLSFSKMDRKQCEEVYEGLCDTFALDGLQTFKQVEAPMAFGGSNG